LEEINSGTIQQLQSRHESIINIGNLSSLNSPWETDWQEYQLGRYELGLSRLDPLTELTAMGTEDDDLARLSQTIVGPWTIDSFQTADKENSVGEWTPVLATSLEVSIGFGATAAWLVFHSRMLAAAAAAAALRDTIDPSQVLAQIADSSSED
jgi:hypothetical protein